MSFMPRIPSQESQATALEHVTYRRSCGWTWGMIIAELRECAAACDVSLPRLLDDEASVRRSFAEVATVLAEEARL